MATISGGESIVSTLTYVNVAGGNKNIGIDTPQTFYSVPAGRYALVYVRKYLLHNVSLNGGSSVRMNFGPGSYAQVTDLDLALTGPEFDTAVDEKDLPIYLDQTQSINLTSPSGSGSFTFQIDVFIKEYIRPN